jgi:WD40 repeat protein
LRGWEWRHLYLRTDASLAKLQFSVDDIDGVVFSPWPSSFGVTPDGKLLFWNTQRSLHFWDSATYTPVITYSGFGPILAVKDDGTKILVDASRDKVLHVLDPVSGQRLATLAPQNEKAHAAAFSANGKRIVTGGADGMLRLWDSASGKHLADMKGHTAMVNCLAFALDDKRIASGSNDKTLRLWDANSAECLSA